MLSKILLMKSLVPFPLSALIVPSGAIPDPERPNSVLTTDLISDLKLLTLDFYYSETDVVIKQGRDTKKR